MVQKLNFSPGLGNSDHIVLTFELTCYSATTESAIPQLDFRRANFQKLDTMLQDVKWDVIQDLEVEIEESYQFLKGSVSTVVHACVPQSKPRLRKKNLYINGKANQLKKKKGILWCHFTRSRKPVDYARYTRCRNELRTLTRNLRRNF